MVDNLRNYSGIGFVGHEVVVVHFGEAVGIILVNSYIIHISIHNIHSTPMKHGLYQSLFQKVNFMYMDKSVKIKCRGILSSSINSNSYKKNKIRLVFILFNVKNNTIQIIKRMNYNQNQQNLQIKLMLMTITWPPMGTFTFSWTKQFTKIHIQLKGRQGVAFIGGLLYTQKYFIHFPTYNVNFFVLCYCLFCSNVDIVKIMNSFSTRY